MKEFIIDNKKLTYRALRKILLKEFKNKIVDNLVIIDCIISRLPKGRYFYKDFEDCKNYKIVGIKMTPNHFITRNTLVTGNYKKNKFKIKL